MVYDNDGPIYSMLTGKCGANTFYCWPMFDILCEGGETSYNAYTGGNGIGLDCPNCDCSTYGGSFNDFCGSNITLSQPEISSIATATCSGNEYGGVISIGGVSWYSDFGY